MQTDIVPMETIRQAILLIRGQKVMLDRDLGLLDRVETRALNQAVKRNRDRFPPDFMFELTRAEIMRISQSMISCWCGRRTRLYAFTEHGIALLARIS